MFDRFVSWAAREAVPLPDPLTTTPALEAFLPRELRGRRIFAVGEADHFIHEQVDYRQVTPHRAGPTDEASQDDAA